MTPVKVKSKAESERDGVKAIYAELRGRPYKADAKDHAAWTALKAVASLEDIEAGWRIALDADPRYLQCNYIWQLSMKWNDIAAKLPKRSVASLGACETCGAPAECGMWGHFVCYPCYSRWLTEGPPGDTAWEIVRDMARAWVARSRPQAKGVAT